MALATQCPHCHTTFRVAHDQLKLRAGLVRCGACKQIFNGIENLLRPEELGIAGDAGAAATSAPTPAPAVTPPSLAGAPSGAAASPASTDSETPPPSVASAPSFDVGKQGMPDRSATGSGTGEHTAPPPDTAADAFTPTTTDTASAQHPITTTGTEAQKDDPLLRMTLMDIAHVPRKPSADVPADSSPKSDAEDDFVEQAIDDLQARPWRRKPDAAQSEGDALDQADAADYEEPEFVRQARRRETIGRALTIFMGTASALLLGVLIAQAAYVFRNQIAARVPQAQPVLAAACERSGCQVGLPAQIDAVSIESSELQTLAPDSNTFSLTVLLRNHSTTVQAWPSIELTLNDASEKPLVRRVFMPRDYLTSSKELERGFAASSEQPLKLYFELSQLKAAGYRVYLFYP
jgi:predicted Zn finger-like uncharacterized protein